MEAVIYRERVLPSKATFSLCVLLAIFLYGVCLPLNELVGIVFGLFGGFALGLILYLKAPVISVTANELKVGRASISRDFLGLITEIPAAQAFKARGQELDARAFTSFQASVPGMLRIEITDPRDSTPYWLFSTRRASELSETLG